MGASRRLLVVSSALASRVAPHRCGLRRGLESQREVPADQGEERVRAEVPRGEEGTEDVEGGAEEVCMPREGATEGVEAVAIDR